MSLSQEYINENFSYSLTILGFLIVRVFMGNSENQQSAKINYQCGFGYDLCSTLGKCSTEWRLQCTELTKSEIDLQRVSVYSTSNSGCSMLDEFEESNQRAFAG